MISCVRSPGLFLRKWAETLYPRRYYAEDSEDKPRKKWRIPYSERREEWYSSLRYFAPEKHGHLIEFLRSEIDLRPEAIKRWWQRRNETVEIFSQRFIEERHQILGNDLAAAHFVIYRGGAVKFYGDDVWKKEEDRLQLPKVYSPVYRVEAIDASNMNLYYDGLQNLVSLKSLKWLSFRNCLHIDDWCLDYISGEYGHTLEYLNIGNCPKVTENGLAALYRLEKLRQLNVEEIPQTRSFEFTCLLLEDALKGLKVEGVSYMKV